MLPSGTIVQGAKDGPGIGILLDCPIPFFGVRRMVHWLRSPYARAPDGIVDDADSVTVRDLVAVTGSTRWSTDGEMDLPEDRRRRVNLLSADGRKLAGLRGWDIPHDRHCVLSDVETGQAEIAPNEYPAAWATSWRFELAGTPRGSGARIDWTSVKGEEDRD